MAVEKSIDASHKNAFELYYKWFDNATPGSRLQYYVGDLRFDRDPENHNDLTAEKRVEIDRLNTLANRLLADAKDGFVKLFQRKVEDNLYEYLADMQRRPMDPLKQLQRDRHRARECKQPEKTLG